MPATKQILLLPTNKGVEVITIPDIVRIQAISNYSKLYFANGKTLVVAKVLRWFEEKLPAGIFIRIHRTHLISLLQLQPILKNKGYYLILPGGVTIAVSRRKKKAVLQALCMAA